MAAASDPQSSGGSDPPPNAGPTGAANGAANGVANEAKGAWGDVPLIPFLVVTLLMALLVTLMLREQPVEYCAAAQQALCEDRLGAEIRVYRLEEQPEVAAICGHVRSDGCAIREVEWGSALCTVYLLESTGDAVWTHEMNHCFGWDHEGDSHRDYEAPWVLNTQLQRARGPRDR